MSARYNYNLRKTNFSKEDLIEQNKELRQTVEEVEKKGFKIIKLNKQNKKEISDELWKKGLTKSKLNTCNQIRERFLRSRNFIKINYDELKSEYLNASNKKNFLIQFHENCLKFKPKTVARKQSCNIDNVLCKRAEFLLLGNYLVSTGDNNISILKKDKKVKYNKVAYKRFSTLNDIIRDEILLLPFYTSFYMKNGNASKVKSLIK
ncbi:hypothetical protein F8M41_010848 [Gigaspora margarita]|uniref:Uncharacterized protein n=1 Tax=Gigaspora margarita TaxID=4874 RepID=A0A8H4A2X4_GIGMA|nr:hypothetical protein F8M41_010848 [Gigaspora margarita]